jgi:hypothetical protein
VVTKDFSRSRRMQDRVRARGASCERDRKYLPKPGCNSPQADAEGFPSRGDCFASTRFIGLGLGRTRQVSRGFVRCRGRPFRRCVITGDRMQNRRQVGWAARVRVIEPTDPIIAQANKTGPGFQSFRHCCFRFAALRQHAQPQGTRRCAAPPHVYNLADLATGGGQVAQK